MTFRQLILCLPLLCVVMPVSGDVVIESKGMTVFGNQEGPKGLTLVPWKVQRPDVAIDEFVFSVSDDVFQPLDRKAFLRQIEYYKQVFGDAEQTKK